MTQATQLEDLFTRLDEHCYNCNGSGSEAAWKETQVFRMCSICYGTGYQPTRAGIELLNFLRRQKKRIERERV